jgi:hypothetical protein
MQNDAQPAVEESKDLAELIAESMRFIEHDARELVSTKESAMLVDYETTTGIAEKFANISFFIRKRNCTCLALSSTPASAAN